MRNLIKLFSILAFFSLSSSVDAQRAEDFQTLTEDGAWCWFSDPRAIFYQGQHKSHYIACVTSKGDIIISSKNHHNQQTKQTIVYEGLQVDDHVNPSILFLPDGRLMVFFTRHNGTLFYTTSTQSEDISSFSPIDSLDLGKKACYTNPVLLSEENNRIYLFYRGGYDWKPNFITSDDLGKSWSKPQTLISKKINEITNRPYTKVFSDGKSSIHFAFTDGHPRLENYNSIYYLRYQNGQFFSADGKKVGDLNNLPLEQESLPKAYDGVQNKERAWIWDLAVNNQQQPVIVYTTLPEETRHLYHYGFWDGKEWKNSEICEAGSAFPRFERPKDVRDREPHYSGGITLDHLNPTIVYLSRPINNRFEIEKWKVKNGGQSFESIAITRQSLKDNVRPVIVRNAPANVSPRLLWMQLDYYRHYREYQSSIKSDIAGDKFDPTLSTAAITEVMEAVADWQIEHFDKVKHHPLAWTNGTLYKGMMEWAKIAKDDQYTDWLYQIGKKHGWQPHYRMYHADDVVVCQMYLEMYRQKKDNRLLAPTQARLEYVMHHPSPASLLIEESKDRWSWCDALFMAPPVYAQLAELTGEERYLEFMHKEFKATYDFLYDKESHLFYRDHRYFFHKKQEQNGEKIFWGRGNGWVVGGLVSLLKELPQDSKYRPFYEQLFKEMIQKIASCQEKSGFWHASLLDPKSYPYPETSASGFFCYAIAYGINAGLIDKEKYLPIVTKGWKALVSAVYADGKLGWVQPIGKDPKSVDATMTEVYGVGAFLLAGTMLLEGDIIQQ